MRGATGGGQAPPSPQFPLDAGTVVPEIASPTSGRGRAHNANTTSAMTAASPSRRATEQRSHHPRQTRPRLRPVEVTRTLYVHRVADWRAWLRKHHKTSREIWLIYYRKSSGKPRISYNDSVEEALCFGWIDSVQKKIDDDRLAQRFTPRRPGSKTSEMNKARTRRLVRERRMTPAGLAVIGSLIAPRLVIAPDIMAAFGSDSRISCVRARRPSASGWCGSKSIYAVGGRSTRLTAPMSLSISKGFERNAAAWIRAEVSAALAAPLMTMILARPRPLR